FLTEFRENILGELLTKLDSPLIKAIDIPDQALYKYFMLVQGDQTSKRRWCQLPKHDTVGRNIARKYLMRQQGVNFFGTLSFFLEFRLSFSFRFSFHQGLGLREEIRQ